MSAPQVAPTRPVDGEPPAAPMASTFYTHDALAAQERHNQAPRLLVDFNEDTGFWTVTVARDEHAGLRVVVDQSLASEHVPVGSKA